MRTCHLYTSLTNSSYETFLDESSYFRLNPLTALHSFSYVASSPFHTDSCVRVSLRNLPSRPASYSVQLNTSCATTVRVRL